jgi:hypothetical protein
MGLERDSHKGYLFHLITMTRILQILVNLLIIRVYVGRI